MAALSRFVRWQLASRLIASPIALPFVEGTSLLVRPGMTGATGNWYCGLLEPGEMAFVLHAMRRDELFVDVGANIGVYTVLAAGVVGSDVIAVEPIASTYFSLRANLNLNALDRVDARNCGLGNAPDTMHFTTSLDCMNRVAREDDVGPTEVVTIETLDNLCGGRSPTIIKIDVEGHELPVLQGAARTLASPALQAVVMETNGSGAKFGVDDDALFQIMKKNGFDPFTYDWEKRELLSASKGAANTIFARDPLGLTAKCKDSPRYQLVNGSI